MRRIEFWFPCSGPATITNRKSLGENEVLLRKVELPRRRPTFAEAMAAIESSPLRFTKSWDEIKEGDPVILFDSSVVIDARDSDSPFHDWAKRQIAAAVQEGGEGGP